jgi:hypothetical protein
VIVLEGQVAHRVRVNVLRSGLAPLARFAFQACSFNHSDISPTLESSTYERQETDHRIRPQSLCRVS